VQFACALLLLSSVADAAPRWRIATGNDALIRVDAARGRIAIADGNRLKLVDRNGKTLAAQALPVGLGEKIAVVELGPKSVVIAGGHGALIVRERQPPALVTLHDGEPVGAAPLADGGFRLCLRGVGVVDIDADGKRRWLASVPLMHCGPEGLAGDGTLFVAAERAVVSVAPDGRIKRRVALPAPIERAPAAWPFGVLAPADDGLYAISVNGEIAWHAAAEDGVRVDGMRAIVVEGRRLTWLDHGGRATQRSTPLETAVESLREAAPSDAAAIAGVPGVTARLAAGALVLIGSDGRERFRLGLPGAHAALPLWSREWIVAREGGVEAIGLADDVLDDPTAAARAISRDPAIDEWAKVAAWSRTPTPDAGHDEIARLGTKLAAAYRAGEREPVIAALDELGLGPCAARPALAVLKTGAQPKHGAQLARMIARGGESIRAAVEPLLASRDAPIAAAHALALIAQGAPSAAPYRSRLLAALLGPSPRLGCIPVENEALDAIVDALGRLGPQLAHDVSKALAADPQPACRRRALERLELRIPAPEASIARLRSTFAQNGTLTLDELALAEALGAAAAPALAEMLSKSPAIAPRLVELLAKVPSAPAAREALLSLCAGRRSGPRAAAIRAVAEMPGREAGAAIAAALEHDTDPALLEELAEASAKRPSAEVATALGTALARSARTNSAAAEDLLLALAEVAPDEAARRALAIAPDGERDLALRMTALRVAVRVPTPAIRAQIESLAADGAIGETAAHALLPFIGLRLDEKLHVTGVEPGSPAERAGLRRGDKLISIDGKRFATLGEQEDHQATLRVGDRVLCGIERAAAPLALPLTVGSALAEE
jgi:hypothetical protein